MRPIRTKIPPFDSAEEIILTDVKCITKQQYSSDLWPLKDKRNCIHKSLKIIKLTRKYIHAETLGDKTIVFFEREVFKVVVMVTHNFLRILLQMKNLLKISL